MIKNAIFSDRGRIINEDVGDLYLIDKLAFITNALEALSILPQKFLLFIITNQAGVNYKIFTEQIGNQAFILLKKQKKNSI